MYLYSPVLTLSPLFNSAMVVVSPVSSETLAAAGKHGEVHLQQYEYTRKGLQRRAQRPPSQLTGGVPQQRYGSVLLFACQGDLELMHPCSFVTNLCVIALKGIHLVNFHDWDPSLLLPTPALLLSFKSLGLI